MLLNASALEVRGGSLLLESFTRVSASLYSFRAVPSGSKTDCPPWYVEAQGTVSACMQVRAPVCAPAPKHFEQAPPIPAQPYKSIAELMYPRSLPAEFLYIPIRCRFQVSYSNRPLNPLTRLIILGRVCLVVHRISKSSHERLRLTCRG